jgi:hypothetical protein
MNELLNLHMKNKYFMEIRKTPNGCVVSTPANIFYKPQFIPEITNYVIENNILCVNQQDYVVPNYASRIVILADVFMKMTKLGIPSELLLCFDGLERKPSLAALLDSPKNLEDKEKDIHLFQNIGDIILGTYDKNDAQKNGVLTAFGLIYDIFAKGGI